MKTNNLAHNKRKGHRDVLKRSTTAEQELHVFSIFQLQFTFKLCRYSSVKYGETRNIASSIAV